MSKYLVSTYGYLDCLVANSSGIYYYIESNNDIHKVITSWLQEYNYRLDDKVPIEIDRALLQVKFGYHIFEDDGYPMLAEWNLIEITKP